MESTIEADKTKQNEQKRKFSIFPAKYALEEHSWLYGLKI